MAKVKTIKPVSPHSSFHWSGMLDPADVKPKDLPDKAGIYMVLACDPKHAPISLPGAPPGTQMPGVVYIGLTGKDNTLKKRFAQVARAWRVKHKWKSPPHDSRTHYEADPDAKRLFAVANVRISYAPLPTDPKTDRPEVTGYAAKLGMNADQFRDAVGMPLTGDKLVADSEAIAIQWFKRQYNYIPMLNRREEGKGDGPPSATELADFLKKT